MKPKRLLPLITAGPAAVWGGGEPLASPQNVEIVDVKTKKIQNKIKTEADIASGGGGDLDSRLTGSRCGLLPITRVHISWLRGFHLICWRFQVAVVIVLLGLNPLAADQCDRTQVTHIDPLRTAGNGGLGAEFGLGNSPEVRGQLNGTLTVG